MKTKTKKILLTAASTALVTAMAAAGTYAYLQSGTDDVVNTFSTNKVKVELTETDMGEDRTKQYNIIPGTWESKDPTVTVDNSVDCYVFVKVEDTSNGVVTWDAADGWKLLDGYTDVYYREVAAGNEEKEFAVISGDRVSYSASLTNEDLEALGDAATLTFTAYAIQKEPFNDPVLAYKMEDPTFVTDAAEFADALSSGGAVVLNGDVAVSVGVLNSTAVEPVMTVTKDTVLDLSNEELSIDVVTDEELTHYPCIISVESGSTLTITGNGIINTEAGENSAYGIDVCGGNLVIESGTFYGAPTAIQVENGSLTIHGGFFDLAPTCKAAVPGYAKYVVNAIDSNYKAGTATISITGGTFVNFDPSANPEGAGTSYVADGYHVESAEQTNGETWYTVVSD